MEGGCTLLSPSNFTLRGYSDGKDKIRTTGDTKRVAACCQISEIAGNCLTLARRTGLNYYYYAFTTGYNLTALSVVSK